MKLNHPNRSRARKRLTVDLSRAQFAELQAGLARLTVSVGHSNAYRAGRIQELGKLLAGAWAAAPLLENP